MSADVTNVRADATTVSAAALPLSTVVEGGVLVVTLAQPPTNEIGRDMLAALEAVARVLREPPAEVRAAVITSALLRGFSAGADLRELHASIAARRMAGASEREREAELSSFLDRIHDVMDGIDRAPVTTVAAVHGVCFGGGLELALACDVIVADRTARFAFPELRLGIIPGFGGVPRLRRDVGNAVVRDLLLTGRSLGAERAHAVGLVSQLVGEGQALAVARRVAEQSARLDRRAVALAKLFAKPDLSAELAEEKALFLRMFREHDVEAALARFAADTSAMPYLPAPEEP